MRKRHDLPGVIVPSTALADVRSKSDRYVPPDSNASTHRSNSDRPMTSVDHTPTGTYRFGCAAMMACGTRKLPSRRAEEFASHNRPTQVSECLSDDVAFRGEGAGERKHLEGLARHAEGTLAAATALNPYIGYDLATDIVKEATKSGRPLREVAREKGVDEATLNKALNLKKIAKGGLI